MGTIRKFKVKNKENCLKKTIACIGRDEDGDFIYMHLKSRVALDKTYINTLTKIKQEYKIPHRYKMFNSLNKEEKKFIESCGGDIKNNTFVTMFDTDSPQYQEIKDELTLMEVACEIVSYFDMDALVENENVK